MKNQEFRDLIDNRCEMRQGQRMVGFALAWEMSLRRVENLYSGRTKLPDSELMDFFLYECSEDKYMCANKDRMRDLKARIAAASAETILT